MKLKEYAQIVVFGVIPIYAFAGAVSFFLCKINGTDLVKATLAVLSAIIVCYPYIKYLEWLCTKIDNKD